MVARFGCSGSTLTLLVNGTERDGWRDSFRWNLVRSALQFDTFLKNNGRLMIISYNILVTM